MYWLYAVCGCGMRRHALSNVNVTDTRPYEDVANRAAAGPSWLTRSARSVAVGAASGKSTNRTTPRSAPVGRSHRP